MFTRDIVDDAFVIETERLALRWPRLADARAIEQLAGEKAVAEMTALIPHPYPPRAAETFIYAARLANATGEALTLVVTPRRKPHEAMGAIAVHSRNNGEPFVGYWLGMPHWGQGFATEALRAIVDTVFDHTEAPALTAGVRVVNPASRRVLEKCGFRSEGSGLVEFPARGGLFPVEHMRLDRRTWASLKGWIDPIFVGLGVRERTGEAMAAMLASDRSPEAMTAMIGNEPC
ncbi:GNAT family protein [Chelatococcus sp. SYSU_G07232]|uniref:GNAT family protein n=1 Tax=Chelatococcus albus TaxID=3047466 RepID=A0ABT7ADV8_9HYPH|nr:GNAT family protein [Chelatococcus sp. SYSU_G07232]MDJ1157557.1 GNAT family protein [Chelatococcus sp. SYSU_G07232]